MKKIYLIAGICLGLGGIVLTAGLLGGGCKDRRVVDEKTVTEGFTKVSVDVKAGEITVLPSIDGSCRLEQRGTKQRYFSASVVEGTLTVVETDTRKWYEHVGIFFDEVEAVLYLPDQSYAELSIRSLSGDIEVGQVRVDDLFAKASSGDVGISNAQAKTISAQTDSGEIDLERITAQESVRIRSQSGDVEMIAVQSEGSVEVQTSSVGIDMEQVISVGQTKVTSSSGGVEFSRCDGGSYDVQTSSGSVKGSILTAKVFQAQTNSGRVRVPTTTTGGVFKVKTSSGNISLVVSG